MLTPVPGIHLRMLLLGMSANMRYPGCIQTGPSVQVKPVATFSSVAWAAKIRSIAGSKRSIVGTIALDASATERASVPEPFAWELPADLHAVATDTESTMTAIALKKIVPGSLFRFTPSP